MATMSKRATIRTQAYGEWVTVGSILSNYDPEGSKPNTIVWMGAWTNSALAGFPVEGASLPYLEGYLTARLLEADVKQGTDDYYQRCGFIRTMLKPGMHGPDDLIHMYKVRLDVFPIVCRQFQKRGQSGIYLTIQAIDKTPADPQQAEQSNPAPDTTTPEPGAMPRALRAIKDFEALCHLDQLALELMLDIESADWTDQHFGFLRKLYAHLSTLPEELRVRTAIAIREGRLTYEQALKITTENPTP